MFGRICRESASVDRNVTKEVKIWHVINQGYSQENIFFADETAIVYKLTLEVKIVVEENYRKMG